VALVSGAVSDDRRKIERHEVWFPMHIVSEGREKQIAVSHDASAKGLLVATPNEMEVGAPVTITLRLPGRDGGEMTVEGVIVRVEPNPNDPDGPLGCHCAIQFDEEIPELRNALEEFNPS
jgi:hypothetical protein